MLGTGQYQQFATETDVENTTNLCQNSAVVLECWDLSRKRNTLCFEFFTDSRPGMIIRIANVFEINAGIFQEQSVSFSLALKPFRESSIVYTGRPPLDLDCQVRGNAEQAS